MSDHKNIHMALCAAQASMGKVTKGAVNPAFKSRYADLADVVSVVMPALTEQGINLHHTMIRDEYGLAMRTVLTHGATETEINCDVPLIVSKQDMQGMKSATTYAKRIGLESLTGIAPEDDDGNAAAASARKTILPAQAEELAVMIGDDTDLKAKITTWKGVEKLDDILAVDLEAVVNGIKKYKSAKKARKVEEKNGSEDA